MIKSMLRIFLMATVTILALGAKISSAQCPATPSTSCRYAGATSLTFSNDESSGTKSFSFKLSRGDSTTLSDLADPTGVSGGYSLCLYEASALIADLTAPGGTSCSGEPCWKEKSGKGYAFKDSLGANDGIRSLKLVASSSAKTMAKLSAKALASGALPLPLASTVTIQLVNNGNNLCFTTTYSGSEILKNDSESGKFKAKSSSDAPPSATPTQTSSRTPTLTRTITATPTSTPSPTLSPTSNTTCPSSNFLNVASGQGPGSSYPTPSLSVACNASNVVVTSNGIPHYQFVSTNPGTLSAQDWTFTFPLNPSVAASYTSAPTNFAVAVAVNGVPIYGPAEAPPTYGDALVTPQQLDSCQAHIAQSGDYHNHALLVKCLNQDSLTTSTPWTNDDPSSSERSPIIGYALDGFPIYGPYECTDSGCTSVVEMLSSWSVVSYTNAGCTSSSQCASGASCVTTMVSGTKTTACISQSASAWSNNSYTAHAGSQYLDRCNGHTSIFGDYHYHTTSAFPYVLGCYSGTAGSGVNG